jgi:hypothetical protein
MAAFSSGKPSGTAAPQETDAAPSVPSRYIWTVLGTLLGSFMLFYILLFGLSVSGNLAPPGFSNSLCVDEKLAYLRTRPTSQPNFLVIGSSVAWRHFDGETVSRLSPAVAPLNGGFCGLAANQSVYTANWLLSHYPSVKEVLLIAGPQDFEDCTKSRTNVFDSTDASDYVFNGASSWPYYIKYFSPAALLRNATTIAAQRSDRNAMDPLIFDHYGSGPLYTKGRRDMEIYGKVGRMDPSCFDAVGNLARRLKEEGRRLMVASTPMNPEWKTANDPESRMQNAFNAAMRKALDAAEGEYWDGDAAKVVSQDAFYDAIHLHWSAVAPFSEALDKHFDFGSTFRPVL